MQKTEICVPWFDTDRENIVYFGNYFRYFTIAEDDYLSSRGLDHNMLKERFNVGFARVEAICRYKHPATYKDLIIVETKALLENSNFLTFLFRVLRKEGRILLAEGKVRTVCVTLGEKIQIVKIPEEVQELLIREQEE